MQINKKPPPLVIPIKKENRNSYPGFICQRIIQQEIMPSKSGASNKRLISYDPPVPTNWAQASGNKSVAINIVGNKNSIKIDSSTKIHIYIKDGETYWKAILQETGDIEQAHQKLLALLNHQEKENTHTINTPMGLRIFKDLTDKNNKSKILPYIGGFLAGTGFGYILNDLVVSHQEAPVSQTQPTILVYQSSAQVGEQHTINNIFFPKKHDSLNHFDFDIYHDSSSNLISPNTPNYVHNANLQDDNFSSQLGIQIANPNTQAFFCPPSHQLSLNTQQNAPHPNIQLLNQNILSLLFCDSTSPHQAILNYSISDILTHYRYDFSNHLILPNETDVSNLFLPNGLHLPFLPPDSIFAPDDDDDNGLDISESFDKKVERFYMGSEALHSLLGSTTVDGISASHQQRIEYTHDSFFQIVILCVIIILTYIILRLSTRSK